MRPFYDTNYIKAITGIRRCGKSVIMTQIIDELKEKGVKNILYYDLESEKYEDIITRKQLENELHKDIKGKGKYYIFIDEVQRIKEFEIVLASIRVSYNCSLFVTGSNSKLLLGKLSDRLTGRAKEFVIEPFTYLESIEYKKLNNMPILKGDFDNYLKWGGMPQRFLEVDDQGLVDYFNGLYNSILKKDVYDRHKRIIKEEFKSVSDYVLRNSGRLFSSTKIARSLYKNADKKKQAKIARNINNYKAYIEECFLINQCKPYIISGRKSMNPSLKYYVVDNGLKTSLTNTVDIDNSFNLENVIYRELKYRGYDVRLGHLYNGEIDFVAIKGTKKCFIQVATTMENDSTIKREFGAFRNIKDGSPKYVLSLDTLDMSHDGITHINIIDFLLKKVDIHIS